MNLLRHAVGTTATRMVKEVRTRHEAEHEHRRAKGSWHHTNQLLRWSPGDPTLAMDKLRAEAYMEALENRYPSLSDGRR